MQSMHIKTNKVAETQSNSVAMEPGHGRVTVRAWPDFPSVSIKVDGLGVAFMSPDAARKLAQHLIAHANRAGAKLL